ncbi:hypothetical protein BGW36DRAFT_307264 [Talaromyces proteolyticus]|uniref:Zn(2)-C6 fungal-type domain-containing protein n=1 Tax=Talaromyces proteolyticus TaxID=1131652 RepID=A0AAD4KFE9_9EURO|nr:uncharacterized protein BGW36DRAFT_307264 [Talaromyces proteolyticus]KAH8689888.1 hypothetical protein BGW36DRAFT_307264 [Talaromyces proteolyticus]
MSAKRKANSDQAGSQNRKRAPRQDPVSCQSCRTKKLKCDRQQPCHNCQTRRNECVYAVNTFHQFTYPTPPSTTTERSSSVPVFTQPVVSEIIRPPSKGGQRSSEDNAQEITTGWLETIVMGPRMPDALPMSMKDKHIPNCANLPTPLASFLPRESEAILLFNYYTNNIDYVYHVIVPDRTLSQITTIYQNVHTNSTVNLNHLALLFSITAAAHYFRNMGSFNSSKEDEREAEKKCREFTTLVGAALTQSNYLNYPTVEGIQATIIICHCVSNLGQEPAIRAYFVHGTMISQGRQLGLHRIDSVQSKECRKRNGYDPVELELKRRLWWQLVSFDWLLGFLSGPQEGTYLIQPTHMSVNMPVNIHDDELGRQEDGYCNPETVPTKMSYAIERLKLATVCREIIDATCQEQAQGIEIEYTKIMDLDRRLNQQYKQIPEFFRLDSVTRRKYAQLYKDWPQISWQRLLLHQGYHARVCRLHRSYFIRGAQDPTYSYSHVMCLQSARRVIEIKRIMDSEIQNMPGSSLIWSVMHHVFMAAAILLMDLCFNWDDILADKRREEILDACRMLDRAQQRSSLVQEGINALMEVMQRYWRPSNEQQHPETESRSDSVSGVGVGARDEDVAVHSLESDTSVYPTNSSDFTSIDNRGLENMWSEFLDNGAPLVANPEEWAGLLADLTDATNLYE